uniref:Nucleoplasmin core domain-containing protein n=1 Tax=Cacopsylla melanoneura TaxID=428564 RepID=A0A8D9A448_9HEMI
MGFRADIKLPIVVLKAGVNNNAPLDLLFTDPPVTFKLMKGSGPIYFLYLCFLKCIGIGPVVCILFHGVCVACMCFSFDIDKSKQSLEFIRVLWIGTTSIL